MTKEEFLSFSLPYELKAENLFGEIVTLLGLQKGSESVSNWLWIFIHRNEYCKGYIYQCKPILHPISDFTKHITHKGETFMPIVKLLENNYFDTSKMSIDEIMSYNTAYIDSDFITLTDLPLYLKWHFDVAGLIEKGEAIDVNTLDKNPYE